MTRDLKTARILATTARRMQSSKLNEQLTQEGHEVVSQAVTILLDGSANALVTVIKNEPRTIELARDIIHAFLLA